LLLLKRVEVLVQKARSSLLQTNNKEKTMTEKIPSHVIVTKTFTYDVEALMSNWAAVNDGIRPTWEEAFEMIQEWAYEDMRRVPEDINYEFVMEVEGDNGLL
jgi:hypothetical protein